MSGSKAKEMTQDGNLNPQEQMKRSIIILLSDRLEDLIKLISRFKQSL